MEGGFVADLQLFLRAVCEVARQCKLLEEWMCLFRLVHSKLPLGSGAVDIDASVSQPETSRYSRRGERKASHRREFSETT